MLVIKRIGGIIMKQNSIYRLSDDWNLHMEDLKERKFYLFNVYKGDIIKLNEVSFDILKNINGENTLRNILDILLEIYEVNEDILLKDIESLMKKCLQKGIIVEL